MFYSESETDFSNLVINSLLSKSKSESNDSESDFNSVFINFDICVFLPYIYTLLNKLADDFFIKIHNRINSYASNASIMHIFFKNHLKKLQTNIITRINISITINQINKHKAKIYNHCVYTHNYYKLFSSQNIRMSISSINFNDKKSDFYKNKNKKYLI